MSRKSKLTTAQVITNAERIFHNIRWGFGIVVCPYCGSVHIREYDGYRYKCNSCKMRFTDRTRTVMHGSKLSVRIWMQAVYEMFTDNFISSNVLSVKLGINQKSAWLLQTKLRYCMKQDDVKLSGVVAQDEMYIGGCLSNFHYSRKWKLLREMKYVKDGDKRYTKDAIFRLNAALKQPVFGMNDGNKIVLSAMPNGIKKQYLWKVNRHHVETGSITVSDESKLYNEWEKNTGCPIYTNNHHDNQYTTKNGLTSNRIENTFSWYKRGFGGRITHCKYHQYYLNEFAFRYNTRDMSTEDRFNKMLKRTIGMTITYKDIRAYEPYKGLDIQKKKEISLEQIKLLVTSGSVSELIQNGKIYTRKDFI